MAVRLISCRHRDTGAEAEVPETGLQHLPAFEPIDPDDRKRLGYDKPAETSDDGGDGPGGEQPPSPDDPTRQSKPATGAAKKTKE